MNKLFLSLFAICFFSTTSAEATLAVTVNQACKNITDKLASVGFQDCLSIDMQHSGSLSSKGFPILLKEYPPLKGKHPKGRILLVGGTHGDELSSISIVFKWMRTLDKHHSGLFHWRVAPLMNPDGALQKKHNRLNANGVDLNRNFLIPQSDSTAALDYWKTRTFLNERRYPGHYPLSEPETQWLFKEIEQFRPDVIIAVHAPYSLGVAHTNTRSFGQGF